MRRKGGGVTDVWFGANGLKQSLGVSNARKGEIL